MTEAVKERGGERQKGRGSVWVIVLLSTCCLPEVTVADIRNSTWSQKLILFDRKESHPPTLSVRIFYATQSKDFQCRRRSAFLCHAVISLLFAGHHLLHSACREIQSFRLRGRRSAGRAGAGWRTGQDRGPGYKGMSLYGQTLDWRGRGQLGGAKHAYGLLSVGTEEQPDPGHLVDDFQRTHQHKLCVCVLNKKPSCVHPCVATVHVYFNVCFCACK